MSWSSYIFPRIIAKLSSPYNKKIRINEERGKLKLIVNGSKQSGEYIAKLWTETFLAFDIPKSLNPRKILVLGVGGGTVIHLLHSYYPQATMLGVDIDQTMIDIGKQYFGLNQIENLSFVCEDAERYAAENQELKRHFDLIIVDLFIGTHVPELVRKESFLNNLKASLTKKGVVVINYLREFEYGEKSESLKKTLITNFPHIEEKSIYGNRFFLARIIIDS